jgi:hypothetical protein
MITYPVIAWFYGHSHNRSSIHINNVSCLINAAGYPGEFNGIERCASWSHCNLEDIDGGNFDGNEIENYTDTELL